MLPEGSGNVVSEENDESAVDSKNIKYDHIANETRTLIK
jgi:hypothetical protein